MTDNNGTIYVGSVSGLVFFIITIVVFGTIVYFMPKRLTPLEVYATSWFALTFVLAVDAYLSEMHGLYGYLSTNHLGWKSLVVTFGIYPTYNAIFLNFFPEKKWKQVLYILGHSIIILTYEWIAIKIGAFHYHEWKLSYSALLYPFIFLILYLNLRLLRMLKSKGFGKK